MTRVFQGQCVGFVFRVFRVSLLVAAGFSISSCSSLLPRSYTEIISPWGSFLEAEAAFSKIIPLTTQASDLRGLGFDPSLSRNLKILNYLDVTGYFLVNPSVGKEDLDPQVRNCIEARNGCYAYEIKLRKTNDERYGNAFLDIFGFRRKNLRTGWEFNALIIINKELVVYKLSSGQPAIETRSKSVKPLGPLQDLEGSVKATVDIK